MNFLILWEQIVSYYKDMTFYNIEVNAFQLLGFVFALGIGGVAAIIIAYFAKKRTGKIIDPIIERGATSEKTAITAEEGGFASPRRLAMLTRGKMLRKTVCVIGDDAEDTENDAKATENDAKVAKGKVKVPSVRELEAAAVARLMTCRFYIPEEKREQALRRFSGKRNSVISLILSVLLMIAIAVALYFFLPFVLKLTDNFLTMVGGNE